MACVLGWPLLNVIGSGRGTSFSGMKAQCGWYSAPASIQRLSVSTSFSVSGSSLEPGGGICSSGSRLSTRRIISASLALPGSKAPADIALSRTSKRRSASRLLESGPWQKKHLSDRMERTSRLKSGGGAASLGGAAHSALPAKNIIKVGKRVIAACLVGV